MGLMLRSALAGMQTAYWMYWCGDELAARRLMIKIAKHALKEETGGKRKQQKTDFEEKSKGAIPYEDDFIPVGGTDARYPYQF